MRSEREKMLAGELYDPLDSELVAARTRARDLLWELNATREAEEEKQRRILRDLFGSGGETVWIQPPFFCDYGTNIHLGEKVYFNFNCVVLDVCEVRIGSRTLIGPAVQLYAATHPLDTELPQNPRVGKASDDWLGRMDRWWGDHPAWRDGRRPRRDRSRERGHKGRARWCTRGGQSVSGSADHVAIFFENLSLTSFANRPQSSPFTTSPRLTVIGRPCWSIISPRGSMPRQW